MKTSLVIAVLAALSVTTAPAACGGSTSGGPRGAAQSPSTTTLSATTVEARDAVQEPTTTIWSSTTGSPRDTAQVATTTIGSATAACC